MPPPTGCEVFPILEDSFFACLRIAVATVDSIRHHPYEALQCFQVVRVSARVVLCVSVSHVSFSEGAQGQNAVNLPIP